MDKGPKVQRSKSTVGKIYRPTFSFFEKKLPILRVQTSDWSQMKDLVILQFINRGMNTQIFKSSYF